MTLFGALSPLIILKKLYSSEGNDEVYVKQIPRNVYQEDMGLTELCIHLLEFCIFI